MSLHELVSRARSVLGRNSQNGTQTCKHVQHARGTDSDFPDEDAKIWYVREKESGKTYWCENDAAYIKLREISTEYVCLGCGEGKTVHTAERIGGEEGIKLKDEMDNRELAEFEENTRSAGFYNGWPRTNDNHPVHEVA